MKVSLILALFVFSLTASAKIIKMAVITSEFDKNYTDYYLETDENNKLESMRYITTMPNGGIFEDITVTADQAMKDGAVIVEREGRQVVRLELQNFDMKKGGTIILDYLFNGATNNRRTKKLFLDNKNGEFILLDNGKRVNRLFLVANWIRVLGVVGVYEIQSSYKP